MTIVGSTQQTCLLVGIGACQTAVILYMYGKG